MSAPTRAKAGREFQLNGWHVLATLIAFFAAVIAVDTVMAVKAYATYPGEVSATPYEDGLTFNRSLAQRDQERRLGWRAKIQTTLLPDVGRTQLRVTIADAAGAPVKGLNLKGELERPATEAGRLALSFTETRAGIYDASAPDTPGAWDLTLKGTDGAGRGFDAQRRMMWR
jgi:nitrogen fixation protein FixH